MLPGERRREAIAEVRTDTTNNIGKVVFGWNALYDLQDFINASRILTLEVREIFQGPQGELDEADAPKEP